MRFKVSTKAREVSFSLPKKLYALEIIQGAAHVLADRAAAFVDEKGKAWELSLAVQGAPTKEALEALGHEFVAEVLNQALRQRLIANARPIYEHIIARAVVSARRDPKDKDQPSAGELSEEQKAELQGLIAEAESELEARRGPVPAAVTRTWEERYGRPRTGKA